jgi:tetratricopeptide (TPR) repeat protein
MQYALDPRLLPPGGVPVQCTRCSRVFTAAPPAQATTQTTQVFGLGGPVPSISPVPSIAPLQPVAKPAQPVAKPAANANSTLLFGAGQQAPANKPNAAPAGTPPSAMTTQLFGAVPQVPPPGASNPQPKPQAGAPAPTTTQAFGAVPQPVPPGNKPPSASTTPPLGSTAPAQGTSLAGRPSSVSLVELFGDLPDFEFESKPGGGEAPRPDPTPAPAPAVAPTPEPVPPFSAPELRMAGPSAHPPGLMPRSEPQAPPAALNPMPASVGVAAGTPIELPDEEPAPPPNPFAGPVPSLGAPLSVPPEVAVSNSPIGALLAEEVPVEELPSLPGVMAQTPAPALSKPLELPPELLDNPMATPSDEPRPNKGLGSRGLLIAGIVVVLALTAFLTSPAWRGKSNAVSQEALVAKEEARVLLRRDDATSKEEALSRFRTLVGLHPLSVELQAERAIALALHLDDTRVQKSTLEAKVKRLQERITSLSEAQTPADWQSRVNAMREEVATAQRELVPFETRTAQLVQEALDVSKQLAVMPAQEETEPALARLRARAMLNASLGGSETPSLAVMLVQQQQQDWSALAMAEYVLNASTTRNQISQAATALERLREKDKTFLRLYVLEARIALLRGEPTLALGLLETVLTLNPKHELAQKLQEHAQELLNPEPGSESASSP